MWEGHVGDDYYIIYYFTQVSHPYWGVLGVKSQ
jgi:hypothetical protein